jgi:diacylglycerol O-acyltransferase / wax synthase
VPHPGKELGMGISILSYRGMASLAVIADAGLVPDPEAITEEFNRQFGRMKRAAQRASAAAAAGAPPRTRRTTRTPSRRKPARPAH